MLSPFSPVPYTTGHPPDRLLVDRATTRTLQRHNASSGALGAKALPPRKLPLDFLLLQYARTGEREIGRAVARTLSRLARSGVHDALGGGFHRGSYDPPWTLPDFGKTLLDNALLATTYLHAWQVLDRPDFGRVATDTLSAIQRELALPDGGFRAGAINGADNLLQKTLAVYHYTWTQEELDALLEPSQARLVSLWWGVQDGTTLTGPWGGRHVLRVRHSLEALAGTVNAEPGDVVRSLDRARFKMLTSRDDRPGPSSSRAFLAAPNGLAVSAFAIAALRLEAGMGAKSPWLQQATEAANALMDKLWNGRRLLHAQPRGAAPLRGSMADYACVQGAMLDLFEASGRLRWLDRAVELERAHREQLDDEPIPAMRIGVPRADSPALAAEPPPDDLDGGAIMARTLLRLATLTGQIEYRERADRLLRPRAKELLDGAIGKPELALAFGWTLLEQRVLSVVHDGDEDRAASLIAAAMKSAQPWMTVIQAQRGADLNRKRSRLPMLEHRDTPPGVTRAWLCRGHACPDPTSSPEELSKILADLERVAS